jgi:amino acid transporter
MYFGWNLGLEKGGTFGLAIATFFIIIHYAAFTLSYTELACAIPKAGGAFDYAERAFGKDVGFLVGMAQNIEFIFAPPAIAFAIGAYFNLFFPQLDVITIAIFVYVAFTALNIYGVKAAATFEHPWGKADLELAKRYDLARVYALCATVTNGNTGMPDEYGDRAMEHLRAAADAGSTAPGRVAACS